MPFFSKHLSFRMKNLRGLVIASVLACLTAEPALAESFDARITIQADRPGAVINPDIYGQFVEHLGRGVYEGIWVGPDSPIPNTRGIRNDVVAALRKIRIPLVRWPGGCFAENYHWRDAIGPRAQRPRGVNTAWGDEVETNQFGTHEFMDFVEQVGAQPYISVNVASGSTCRSPGMDAIHDGARKFRRRPGTRAQRTNRALENSFHRHRQRDLGLRRQHDRRVLLGHLPPVRQRPQALRHDDRLRREFR